MRVARSLDVKRPYQKPSRADSDMQIRNGLNHTYAISGVALLICDKVGVLE